VNCYFPFATIEDPDRLSFKQNFNKAIQLRVEGFLACGLNAILMGDINVSHNKIDHCNPKKWEEEAEMKFEDSPMRQWFSSLLDNPIQPLVDTFRRYHPTEEQIYSCWNTMTGARRINYGTRIDYVLMNETLVNEYGVDCQIQTEIFGSDHCPVVAELNLELNIPQDPALPKECAKFMKELGMKRTMKDFFGSKSTGVSSSDTIETKDSVDEAKNILATQEKRKEKNTIFNNQFKLNSKWSSILTAARGNPLCYHREPTKMCFVQKDGPNKGKAFYLCARPTGNYKLNKESQCNYFAWVDKIKREDRAREAQARATGEKQTQKLSRASTNSMAPSSQSNSQRTSQEPPSSTPTTTTTATTSPIPSLLQSKSLDSPLKITPTTSKPTTVKQPTNKVRLIEKPKTNTKKPASSTKKSEKPTKQKSNPKMMTLDAFFTSSTNHNNNLNTTSSSHSNATNGDGGGSRTLIGEKRNFPSS